MINIKSINQVWRYIVSLLMFCFHFPFYVTLADFGVTNISGTACPSGALSESPFFSGDRVAQCSIISNIVCLLYFSFDHCIVCSSSKIWRYQRTIRNRKSKRDRQHNTQKIKDKVTNDDLENTTQKTKYWATRTL